MLRFRLGRLEVTFSFWFFAVILLFVLLDHQVLVLYIALPILIHETGHMVVMALCGVKIRSIAFTPFSLRICRTNSRMLPVSRELLINLAGILANLLAAGWLYLFCFQSMRIMFLIAANLAVALFNLMPIGNLDGGELCRIICERLFVPSLARAISRGISLLVLTPLFAVSILLLLRQSGNFTLLLTCIYLAGVVILRD